MPSSKQAYEYLRHSHATDDWLAGQQRGLLHNEVPLRPDLTLAPELLQRVDLRACGERNLAAQSCLVANALLAHWQDQAWTFYSRDHGHFAQVRAGVPAWYTRKVLVGALDALITYGLLEERRTAPSPTATHRSRFRATSALMEAGGSARLRDLRWAPVAGRHLAQPRRP
jgi:hypothetical protein